MPKKENDILYEKILRDVDRYISGSDDALTNLPNSKLPAIIIIDDAAPANNLDKPNTEKYAALPATSKAAKPT